MKHVFTYMAAMVMLLAACKKEPQKGTQDPIIPNGDIIVMVGQSEKADGTLALTTWSKSERNLSYLSDISSKLYLPASSLFAQGNVVNGIRPTYFTIGGNEKGEQRVYYYNGATGAFIADALDLGLTHTYTEAFQAKGTEYDGNMYVLVYGARQGQQRGDSYYYKIEGYDGKCTYHDLPTSEYGNGYSWAGATSKGLVVSWAADFVNMALFICLPRFNPHGRFQN
jgi:hypothetical protein